MIMHITRGGGRVGQALRCAGTELRAWPVLSVPLELPMHITLVSLLFHVIFFYPKKIFFKS